MNPGERSRLGREFRESLGLSLFGVLRACSGRGADGLPSRLQCHGSGDAQRIQVVCDADVRIPRMADRAYRCESCFLTAEGVCLSKRLVVAAAGVFLRRRPFSERNGPHAGDDLWSNRLNHSFRASGAWLLFFSAAFRKFDLSSDSFACNAPKPGSRFLKV